MKGGSRPISRVLSWTVIHLGSSNLPGNLYGPHQCSPIWSCSEWGLPCHCCYQQRGALLPHHFNLTCAPVRKPKAIGGIFSAALSSVGSRPPGITWHSALWSPDFPPYPFPKEGYRDCLADFRWLPYLSAEVLTSLNTR